MQKKPLFITLLLITLTGVVFWGGSRYPSLNEKAMMGGDTGIDGIGFETLIHLQSDASVISRIGATTVNWIYSNLQGMTFGLIFGALMMILVTLLSKQYQKQNLPKTLMGGIMGVPLGVCVNCATPIAQGIYASGMDAETALALMFSSPTLNVIVLSMMFSLMPTYMAIVKIGLTVFFILVLLPLLMRWSNPTKQPVSASLIEEIDLQMETFGRKPEANPLDSMIIISSQTNTWFKATKWVLTQFFGNLWYICRITLPLMLLAGFLGSIAITLFPFDALTQLLPTNGLVSVLIAMVFVAGISLFLPVPMSFDVIVTVILLASGLPVYYAATMLFALGIFSVYPFGVIISNFSKGIAISLSAALILLSLSAGALSYQWEGLSFAMQEKQMLQQFSKSDSLPYTPAEQKQDLIPDRQLVTSLQEKSFNFEPVSVNEQAGLSVFRAAFNSESTSQGKWHFEHNLGSDIGLDQHDNFSALKLSAFSPFTFLRGIASGDVHHDGWDDVVVASDSGFNLYANQQGKGYIEQKVDFPDLSNYQVGVVALVDMNNDNWLDLYFTTHRKGNYVIYNQSGRFLANNIAEIPNDESAFVTNAAAFGDLDKDGDLDLVQGNWSQLFRDVHHDLSESQNVLLTQEKNGRFDVQKLPGEDGETHSVLFSDLNNDDSLDLLVGNDFYEHDHFYLGDGKGKLNPLTPKDEIIPLSTTWTMSLATGDLNNDLIPEMYAAQISEAPEDQTIKALSVKPEAVCREYPNSSSSYQRCLDYTKIRNIGQEAYQKKNVFRCQSLPSQEGREACLTYFVSFESRRLKQHQARNLCSYFPASWNDLTAICNKTWEDIIKTDERAEVTKVLRPKGAKIPIPSDRKYQLPPMDNLLLEGQKTGKFANKTKKFGLGLGGWSWNSKFADLNNDRWQDLFIVNGAFHFAQSKTSNLFYENQQGEFFTEKATDLGLRSFQDTVSYTYTDYDRDGDLDIISVPAVGSISLYRNTNNANNSIAFALKDNQGNSFGLGSKIIIRYGNSKEQQQMREIQAGGGFASFDSPIAYFGLGKTDKIREVEIVWSTGEKTKLDREFQAGYQYLIERPKI